MEKRIYLADDEENIRMLIASFLQKEGYVVEAFADGSTLFQRFCEQPPDMVIIDIMMPGMDGYSLCREIRKVSDLPVIMVSARDQEFDRILGLELGSDDYLAKPFSPRELVVRVRNIFKRMVRPSENEVITGYGVRCGDLTVSQEERRVTCLGKDIELTTREFELLSYFVQYRNRVFTREQLIQSIWGYDYVGDSRSVDDLVKRLRKKLVDSKTEIVTVWGYGYKMTEGQEAAE